jgi:hypothetical protein
MTTFEVAHLHEQGQDIIIVVVSSSFGHKSTLEQRQVADAIQSCASAANLRGTVVPVWDSGGQMGFLAPQQWHPFFRSMSLADVAANINRSLTCG